MTKNSKYSITTKRRIYTITKPLKIDKVDGLFKPYLDRNRGKAERN